MNKQYKLPKVSNKRQLLRDGRPECYKFRSLPKFLIELLGWKPNDIIEFAINKDGELVLRNMNRKSKSVVNMLFEMKEGNLGKVKIAPPEENSKPGSKKRGEYASDGKD